MNIKIKRSLAILLPAMGIAVVGAVGAQALVMEPESSPAVLTNELHADLIGQPAFDANGLLVGTVTNVVAADRSNGIAVVTLASGETVSVPVNDLGQVIVAPTARASDTIILAQADPILVAQNNAATQGAIRVDSQLIELPRAASRRSGEGSGEEIATRTNPIDVRASLFPQYSVDHSPGGT